VPPVPDEPDFDACIFICESCRAQVGNPKKRRPETLRPLANTVWSDVPAVQVAAVRVLRDLAPGTDWAREALENLFLDPDVESWADEKG
jgi:protein PhnA